MRTMVPVYYPEFRCIASACRPRLSTVALPLFEIGQRSAWEMLRMLAGEPSSQHLIQLECEIIERESSRKG